MRCKKHFNGNGAGLLKLLDVLTGGGVALIALAGVVLMSVATHAESAVVDPITVTLETSCTLSGTVNTPHTAEVLPGTYTEGIGTTTIKALCNDVAGFSVYAVGYTGDTLGSNVLASGVSSTYDIPTGTATSGNSAWAMKVNAVTGVSTPTIVNSFDNYHTVPSSYTKVATYSGATDLIDGSLMTTTYAVNVSNAQLSGDYTGKVRYVMVHPSTASGYTIIYNATGGTVSPVSEVVTLGSTTTLPTPTKSGYSFTGWYTAATGGTKIGDAGDTYDPTTNLTMYAQWEEAASTFDSAFAAAGKSKTGNYYRMDDMTSSICEAVSVNEVGTLVDDRGTSGAQTYTVAKLADGKCWMTQNLRLTYSTSSIQVSDGLGGVASWTPSLATYTATGTWGFTTTPESYYGGDTTNGAYYNWAAAIASNNSESYGEEGDEVVNTSICPKGWKLPQNAESAGSWWTLYQNYNSLSAMMSNPVNLIFSGRYIGDVSDVDDFGSYWTNTANDSWYAYYLYLDHFGDVSPHAYGGKDEGLPVRCVSI